MSLRPYQAEAVRQVISYFRAESAPGCVVLPTGAGKSHIIAELAQKARGRVLVLAHVKELCEQNYRKFTLSGKEAGLYSAGLGQRSTQHKVTFASVQSVAPHLAEFERSLSLLVIDECHRVNGAEDTQYQRVIAHFRAHNATLKILGLTATPYRLDMGWCYQRHSRGILRTDEERPFARCIYEVTLRELIDQGYLTRPLLRPPEDWAELVQDRALPEEEPSGAGTQPSGAGTQPSGAGTQPSGAGTQPSGAGTQPSGAGTEAEPDGLFGEGALLSQPLARDRRATELITARIVALTEAEERKGVMIFAATTAHARAIAELLPLGQSALILGDTQDTERDELVARFCAQTLRYLVNVSVLTTGFDAPHVDFIAILRATESVSLFQQIVGRGLRLSPGKKDCLVIDYAKNGFDVFTPEVGEKRPSADSEVVPVQCPLCGHENQFWGRRDEEGRVVEHFGRRCHGISADEVRCDYRFVFKECPHCHGENDIAARGCGHCDKILVDPDEMLKNALLRKDTLVLRVSGVHYEAKGSLLRLTYHDEDGATVSERFDFAHVAQRAVFNRVYARRLAGGRRPLELATPEQALGLQALLPRPDFVIAKRVRSPRKAGRQKAGERGAGGGRTPSYFRVERRIFNYSGAYRNAAPAGPEH